MSTKVEFESIREKMAEQKRELARVGKQLFQEACAHIFQQHLEVSAIAWEQYTPYFNDGEACTFGVNDPTFYGFGEPPENHSRGYGGNELEGHYELYDTWGTWNNKLGPKPASYDTAREFAQMLKENEDVMEALFGDHVRVVVTRQGVAVQDYEHD